MYIFTQFFFFFPVVLFLMHDVGLFFLLSSSRESFITVKASTPGTSPTSPSVCRQITAGFAGNTTSTTWARYLHAVTGK